MKHYMDAADDKGDLKQKLTHLKSISAQILHEMVEHSIHHHRFKVLHTDWPEFTRENLLIRFIILKTTP